MKGVAATKRVQVNWTNRSPETVEGCRASSSIVSHGLAEGMFSTRGSTRRCQQGLQVDVAAVDLSAQSWTNNVGPAIDQRFKSLSAIARLIAGCPWSGPAFFGLKSTKKEVA